MKKLLLTCAILFSLNALGQDIEKILTAPRPSNLIKNKEIKISGNLGAGFSWYKANSLDNRNPPFFYELKGGVMIDILGKIKMPFTFSYLNNRATSTLPGALKIPNVQPFNRFQLKPRYKGFEMIIGTGSMNFSKFTLAGHRFDGLGLMYKGKNFPIYGGLVAGRFLKRINAIPEFSSLRPTYKRTGYSGFIGYKHDQDLYEASVFTAKDIVSDIDTLAIKKNINPLQNIATSLKTKTTIYKNLAISTDIGFSKLINLNALNQNYRNVTGKWAAEIGLNYTFKEHKIGLEYQRIDPDYATLGAYFFNRDIQLATVNYQGAFLEQKALSINTKIGQQRRNLNLTEPQTIKGLEGSIDVAYTLKEKYSFNSSYSTFSSFSNFNPYFAYLAQTPYFENIDTLNYRQVNKNLTFAAMLPITKTDTWETMVNLNSLYQAGNNQAGAGIDSQNMQNYMFSYSLKNLKKNWQTALLYNFVISDNMGLENRITGPSLQVSLSFLNSNLTLTNQAGYTTSKINNALSNYKENSAVLLNSFMAQYTLKKQHKLALRFMLNKKYDADTEFGKLGGFTENTLRVSYKYTFDVLKFKIIK